MTQTKVFVNPGNIKIAIAQINCVVGDLEGNSEKIFRAAQEAARQGADIVVTPELALVGYPPEDLLLRPLLYARTEAALEALAARLAAFAGLYVLVGHPQAAGTLRYNAVTVLCDGRSAGTYRKHDLPNYDVFDEQRYFVFDHRPLVFEVKGVRFGVNICEDTWFRYAPAAAKAAGAQVLLVPNGSPYHMHKAGQRCEVMRENVTVEGLALVYANLVGGQDELVFDGGSFVLDAQGEICVQMAQFEEELAVVEFDGPRPLAGLKTQALAPAEEVYRALVLGVRDYVGKNGFPGALIGLSGGVDSALTLAVAVDALGSDRVRAIMMPSSYTAEISWLDARAMAEKLGVRYDEIGISPMTQAFGVALSAQFAGLAEDATEENIQARVRGTLLMALSNKTGRIVLTTGNKSEMATGYCTLYGDMAGGFAVIKDILKTLVYEICAWRNQTHTYSVREVIPERILTRPPSAELRPNQTDQDSLPPYDVLDGIIKHYMEEERSAAEIVALGYPDAEVRRVVRLIRINEYKRRQAPVGIRVTHRAFGRDWRYPITNRFLE
ncbi:MAG: NAD+ synthase [Burkholderiaceae bacterium]|jgi:NAD+ synthase (glutamine-hydrolysing)